MGFNTFIQLYIIDIFHKISSSDGALVSLSMLERISDIKI